MRIRPVLPALGLLAAVSLSARTVRAQEGAPPPIPDSSAVRAFLSGLEDCLYNPYRWSNRAIGAEMREVTVGTRGGSFCGGNVLTAFHSWGPLWSYMLSDRMPRPEQAPLPRAGGTSQAGLTVRDETAIDAPEQPPADVDRPNGKDREPGQPRAGHAAVPRLGEGYGSSELVSQRLLLRVAPESKPTMYDGIPIVERGRSWERIQTADGRRVWLETGVVDHTIRRPGAGMSGPANAPSVAVRSFESPRGAGATFPSSSSSIATGSPPAPSVSRSPGAVRSPQGGKKTAKE